MSKKPEPRDAIGAYDAAARFGVTPKTIYDWIKQGRLTVVKHKRGLRDVNRVTLESIEALEKARAA